MKAIILAAGEGLRLRPLTDTIPKCLVPINGKPLIRHWLDKCEVGGITNVLINGHYLAEKLQRYLEEIKATYSLRVHYVYEPELYGTGGTLKRNADFVADGDFFFCHGDNFTNLSIADFARFHHTHQSNLSVALFETNVPRQCGIAEEMDKDDRIVRFVEKPDTPTTNLASAAIFLMSPSVFEVFPNKDVIDFSKEVLPKFQGKMYGYRFDGFNIDVGTPANYELAQQLAIQHGIK